jgi:hypothetical protein
VEHAGNLYWTCHYLFVPPLHLLTLPQVTAAKEDCKRHLEALRQSALKLRNEHLRSCLDLARARGNANAVKTIVGILCLEANQRRWRFLRRTVQPDRGGAVTQLRVPGTHVLYASQEGVEREGVDHISRRYKTAQGAPIIQDPHLHQDFGYLVDTDAADWVLCRTYDYPADMDPYTKLLVQDAHHIFSRMSKEEVVDFVTTTDFQQFWLHADEQIQSSKSGIHFGHYKAVACDRFFLALQAAKLTLAATTGIPLARWGNGLTVLLEKVFRNIYIDKMRAICLLDADYNWLNKFVFAKRMMDRAFQEDIVLVEQFAKRGSQAAHGVVASGLFCDIACALHRMAAIESVDFANCYNAVAHPIASIALQSFKVRKVMVAMMLSVLQTMKWYLKTAFGQSATAFCGTLDDPLMGFRQGNGASPSGFLAVNTLLIKVYQRQGHGAHFAPGLAWDAFTIAAVINVDDSDLLHLARGTPTDAEFLESVQAATIDWTGLVHTSGGSLKPAKCFWYMLGWKWVKGEARLKALGELPQQPLMIPQQGGQMAAISLHPVDKPEKKLGVYVCPTGDFTYHVDHLWKTGLEYTSRLQARNPPPRDCWMGTGCQLYPKLIYGAVFLTHDPDKLKVAFQLVWYSLLPLLKVNHHITKEFCTLPLRFQGFLNPNIDVLSSKIHLIREHWGRPCNVVGNMLAASYLVFQNEVGIGGKVLL